MKCSLLKECSIDMPNGPLPIMRHVTRDIRLGVAKHRAIKWTDFLYVGLALTIVHGCAKPDLIPQTKIKDTPQHREILQVVESYRRAMESLDPAGILTLAHPTYQDHSGTPEGSDDVDYEGLKKLLATRFKRATKIRYRIEYQELRIKGQDAEVDAYVDATFVYEAPNSPPRWRRLTDHNRFRLLKEGNRWRFLSGL